MTETYRPSLLADARPLVDPNAGGVRRVAEQLFISLLDRDMADWTFVTTGSKLPSLPSPFQERVEHVHINWPNKFWSAASSFGVVSLDRAATRLTGRHYDAAILPNLGFSGYMEIPFALVLHDLSFLIEPAWFRHKSRLWHRAINVREQTRRANRIFCVSETTARDAERFLDVPKEKLEVFHPGIPPLPEPNSANRMSTAGYGVRGSGEEGNGTETTHDTQRMTSNSSLPTPHSPYVLTLNERDPRKNVPTAVEAVRELRTEEAFRDLELVIVGSDHEGEENGVRRLGRIQDEKLAALYANASAFLYPSWYEGFGLPLHEAARFGTPCLASAHGALPETAPEGTLLLPPMKPQLWSAMLREVLRDPSSYRTAFDAGLEGATVHGFIQWCQRLPKP